MLKLTRPKNGNGNLYYVTSEKTPGVKHIVVRHGKLFFCDCTNFMVQKLPYLGRPEFSLCKHGQFVYDVIAATPEGVDLLEANRPNSKDSYFEAVGIVAAPTVKKVVSKIEQLHKKASSQFRTIAGRF